MTGADPHGGQHRRNSVAEGVGTARGILGADLVVLLDAGTPHVVLEALADRGGRHRRNAGVDDRDLGVELVQQGAQLGQSGLWPQLWPNCGPR